MSGGAGGGGTQQSETRQILAIVGCQLDST